MATITAIYENSVFRPIGPVDLPIGSRVVVEPEDAPSSVRGTVPSETSEGLIRIYEVLARRHDGGCRDTTERHNEHQP